MLVRTSDAGGLVHDQLLTINVNDLNLAPTATNLNVAETYKVNSALDLTDIQVADADGTPVTVTLTLSNPVAGSLTTGSAGTATSSFNSATGVWTVTGSIAEVNALLAQVEFVPAVNQSGDFSLGVQVSDGTAPALIGTKIIKGQENYFVPSDMLPDEPPAIENETDSEDLNAEEPAVEEGGVKEDSSDVTDFSAQADSESQSASATEPSEEENLSQVDIQEAASKTGRNAARMHNGYRRSEELGALAEHSGTLLSLSEIAFMSLNDAGNRLGGDEVKLPTFVSPHSLSIDLQGPRHYDLQILDRMLLKSIQSTEGAIDEVETELTMSAKLAVGGSFVFSIGVTSWLFRASSLVSAVLSTMPLWKRLDPLPVLSLSGKERIRKQKLMRAIEDDESQSDKELSAFFNNEPENVASGESEPVPEEQLDE